MQKAYVKGPTRRFVDVATGLPVRSCPGGGARWGWVSMVSNATSDDEGYVTTADGVRLWYRRAGTGAGAVLIPNGFYLFDDLSQLARDRVLVAYDLRNRGRSDAVAERAKLERGIAQDADDLEAVRRHFGF